MTRLSLAPVAAEAQSAPLAPAPLPGPGLTLPSREVCAPEEALLQAEPRVITASGQTLHKRLPTPVRLVPVEPYRACASAGKLVESARVTR